MLYIALFFSAILLIATNCTIRLRFNSFIFTAVASVGVCLPTVCIGFISPAEWELGAALIILAAVATTTGYKRCFLPASLLAAVAVFGVNSWLAWSDLERLEARYPYESLDDRLPERPVAELNLSSTLEGSVATAEWEMKERVQQIQLLHDLHENTVEVFINRPGFGAGRMTGSSEHWLRFGNGRSDRFGQPLPQPKVRSTSAGTWDEVGDAMKADDDLGWMHHNAAFDFVHPGGFGYVKDRRHVAGFQSHRFSEEPTAKHWKLQSLELIGLVVHAKPVAYMSANLPRMDELRRAPTRELNAFESAGLTALRGSEDLYVRRMPDGGVRMLGAVRSLKQCLSCHGGARGDLLGAFSYELRREEGK